MCDLLWSDPQDKVGVVIVSYKLWSGQCITMHIVFYIFPTNITDTVVQPNCTLFYL